MNLPGPRSYTAPRETATRRLRGAERVSRTAPGTSSSALGRPRFALRSAKPPRRGFTGVSLGHRHLDTHLSRRGPVHHRETDGTRLALIAAHPRSPLSARDAGPASVRGSPGRPPGPSAPPAPAASRRPARDDNGE